MTVHEMRCIYPAYAAKERELEDQARDEREEQEYLLHLEQFDRWERMTGTERDDEIKVAMRLAE